QAWPAKDRLRAAEHLLAGWTALQVCLRERRGGRDRSIPFVERLSDYIDFLDASCIEPELWLRTDPSHRASTMVEQWGRALPRLSMFTIPALASVVGMQVDPSQPIPSKTKSSEGKWAALFEEILAENKETATD